MGCNDILLSIIVPVYNVESYLSRCLDSLLSIKGLTFEIILVNDGSTDNSLQICQQYKYKYPYLFKFFTQENKGQSSARNLGLKKISGKYVAFIDSDDSVEEKTLEDSIAFLEENTWCDIVQFPVLLEANSDKEEYVISGKGEVRGIGKLLYEFSVNESITWRVCDKVFRYNLIKDLQFQEGLVYEDNLYMCEALIRSTGVYLSDWGCYNYFHNPNSTTHAPSAKSFIDMCIIHGEMFILISNNTQNKTIRTHMLYKVINDMYASYKAHRGENDCTHAGVPYVRVAKILDIIGAKHMTARRKVKILSIKIWSHIV